MKLFVILIFLCLSDHSNQKATTNDDHYTAAVVEYEVRVDVNTNLQNYIHLVRDAAEQNADIVVFPEMTLTTLNRAVIVPTRSLLLDHPVPALQPDLFDQILVNLSSTARENRIYVVVNLQEVMDCTDAKTIGEYCPELKRYLFNTNVVFDRNGAVIDRYRKINLFGEFTRTPALKPDLGVFSTDFGVTFGHYICFDLMFQVPAVQVVEKHNLTDIIFSTMWFSEMPYLTAVQIQEAYAYSMNVNFIASGANNVRVGSAGSGIYSGKAGALVSIMPGKPTTRLLVAKVPKIPGQLNENEIYPGPIYDVPTDQDNLLLLKDISLPSHVSRPLAPGFQEFTLVDKEVSCKFTVRLNHREGSEVKYRAFVYDGTNLYAHRRDVRSAQCLVAACRNDDVVTCPYRFKDGVKDVEIEELDIEMRSYSIQYNKTLECDNVAYFPVSFQTNKFPLSTSNFTFTRNNNDRGEYCAVNNRRDSECWGGREYIKYNLNVPQDKLVAFGIWGRVYTNDVSDITEGTQDELNKSTQLDELIYNTIQ